MVDGTFRGGEGMGSGGEWRERGREDNNRDRGRKKRIERKTSET
jgi:hypothetical protein